jgi:hypothetical protein
MCFFYDTEITQIPLITKNNFLLSIDKNTHLCFIWDLKAKIKPITTQDKAKIKKCENSPNLRHDIYAIDKNDTVDLRDYGNSNH